MRGWISILTIAAITLLGGCEEKKPPPPPKPVAEAWRYAHDIDPMSGKPRYSACLRSDNAVQLSPPYKPTKGVLCLLRDARAGSGVVLRLEGDGQIVCDGGGPCAIAVRFDERDIEPFKIRPLSDGSTNAVTFPDQVESDVLGIYLGGAHKARFELEFYRNGHQVLIFSPQGLDFSKTGWDGKS